MTKGVMMAEFAFAEVDASEYFAPHRFMKSLIHQVVLLLAGLLFLTTVFATLNTIVPLWLSHDSIPTWLIGMVSASFFVGNLAGTLLAGEMIPRMGYKTSFVISCLLCLGSTACLIPVGGLAGWMSVRFIAGISCALVWVVVESALLRLGTNSTRGGLLAAYMVVYYIATVLGQLLVTVLPDDRMRASLWIGAIGVASLLPIVVLRCGPADPPRPFATIWAMLFRKRPRLSVLGSVISGIVLGSIYGLMPLFLVHKGMSNTWVGYWMALLIGAGIVGQWPFGRMADVKGRYYVLKLQSWLIIAACLLLALDVWLGVALVILGCASFSLYPVTLTLGCDRLPKEYLVPMNQTLLLSFTVGSLAGPMGTSSMMEQFSDAMMPVCMAVMAGLYLMILIVHGRRQGRPALPARFKGIWMKRRHGMP